MQIAKRDQYDSQQHFLLANDRFVSATRLAKEQKVIGLFFTTIIQLRDALTQISGLKTGRYGVLAAKPNRFAARRRRISWRLIGIATLLTLIHPNRSAACQIASLFSGDMTLAKVTIPPDPPYDGYNTYLVRNHMRDPEGVLTDFIKVELVPARWGFDVKLPSGERIGQVMVNVTEPNVPKGAVEISADESDCANVDLLLRIERSPNQVAVFSGKNQIGAIHNFPHALLRANR